MMFTITKGSVSMAYDHDEIRKRQLRRRQEARAKRQRQARQRRKMLLGLAAGAVILGLCLLVVALVRHAGSSPGPDPDSTVQSSDPTQPTQPQTVISLSFGGDVNVTDQLVSAGKSGDGYDFTQMFMDLAPLFAGSDCGVVNFEGNLCGGPYGTTGTRAPQELAQALKSAGVDLVQMANSCALNNGLLGLSQTLDGLRTAGLEPVGAFSSQEEAQKYKGFTLRSIQGVKVAFVAFTKGMDDLGLPTGSEDQINLLYTDYTSTYQDVDEEGIREVLSAVALEKPDITIALLHWGSKYNNQISASQTQIAELMLDNGVDAIVGTHSHYLQKIDYDAEKDTLVAWSLGDLVGDAERAGTEYSAVLQLEITKDNRTGEAAISGYTCTPIYTQQTESGLRVLRIEPAIAAYEANALDKVDQQTYAAMVSALDKIRSKEGLEGA